MSNVSYQTAMSDVQKRVAASRSSFTAGMAILPKARREAMFALYAFCREVDDIADDGATLVLRQKGLAEWRGKIADLFQHSKSSDTITAALIPAIRQFNLIEQDFQDIITGMAMDAAEPICAPDLATLDLYCDHVASAVGRASVRIFGDDSEAAQKVAYHQGRALQLTNILRDLAEDAERERLYLPRDFLLAHSITNFNPHAVLQHAALPLVCRDVAAIAGEHFNATAAAMEQCKPAAMRPAKMMLSYYRAIYQRLLATGWHQLSERVSLPASQKVWLMLKGWLS